MVKLFLHGAVFHVESPYSTIEAMKAVRYSEDDDIWDYLDEVIFAAHDSGYTSLSWGAA